MSSKKTTTARAKRHEKRQMELEHEPIAKKHCPKKLDFKNATDNRERDFVDMNKIRHDHSYLCRQEQAIPEDSTVSSDVSLSPGTTSTECQTGLTTDEIEYVITELEECRKKITIIDGKVENKKRLIRELNTKDMLKDDESVKSYTGLPMIFASTATVSSSCSTQLSCDINFQGF